MAAKRPLRRRNRRPWVRLLKRVAVFFSIVFFVVLSAGLAVYIPIYREAVDDAANIENHLVVNNQNPTVIISADNKTMYSYSVERRTVVDLKKLPKYVGYALVAAEDRRFYDHKGVDPIGLLRVAYTAVRERHVVSGGSTISMQLAKNLINGDEKTPLRKLKDIATAQQIENLKSKDEILNLYANYAYYGEHAFGIERAAQVYFGKSAGDLTVGEAAMLARCVRLPSRVNPIRDLDKMIGVRNYVLDVMLEEGWITSDQHDEGYREVPKVKKSSSLNGVPPIPAVGYFVDHVQQELKDQYPGIDFQAGGYRVETTLNYQLQKRATEAVAQILAENRGRQVNDGAFVAMDQYGRIRAEVGGASYKKNQFNVVTTGKRQPGSAFKAFVYATALRDGIIDLNTRISNARIPTDGQGRPWDPENASRSENGNSYSLDEAFARSINRPAIHTIMDAGEETVVAAAHSVFGIKSPLLAVPSLALGTSGVKPLEMLEAYSVFMLGGDRAEPYTVVRVIGPDGKLIPKRSDPVIHRGVLDARVAQQMDQVMKGPVAYGTATAARIVPNARGKTGTTNDAKDAWFCGYSDGLVGVGWVGNSGKNGEQLKMSSSVFGGTVTVHIWTAVMESAHRLGLATGIKGTPNTSVSVAVSPEEPRITPPKEDVVPAVKPDPIATDPNEAPADLPRTDPVDAPPATEPDPTLQDPPATADIPPAPVDPPKHHEVDPPKRHDAVRRTEPAKHTETKRPEPPQEVDVVICVDTGMRAGAYCPETVTRRFPRNRVPRARCNVHHG